MRFIPHTVDDDRRMLDRLGLSRLDDLFAAIPAEFADPPLPDVPGPMQEEQLLGYFAGLAARNRPAAGGACFLGGGAYDHYVPSLVRHLACKPELMTSYTPYQAESNQGVLQALFEFQTLVTELTGMDVANASLYDGATGVVEAMNMARTILPDGTGVVSRGVNPRHRATLDTLRAGWELAVVEARLEGGRTVLPDADRPILLLQQPNYLGVLEDAAGLAAAVHERGGLVIVSVDPVMLGVLAPPASWGADIVTGDAQMLGNPLWSGGPGLGILACRTEHVRRLPGRIVSRAQDAEGRTAYTLALQTREQHIRREKATSNICTNHTLNAIIATVYLAWLGPAGLRAVAERSVAAAHAAVEALEATGRVHRLHPEAAFGREAAVQVEGPPGAAQALLARLREQGVWAGPALPDYPEAGEAFLVAGTERRTPDDVALLGKAVANA